MAKKIFILDEVHPLLSEGLLAEGFELIDVNHRDKACFLDDVHQAFGLILRSKWPVDAEMIARARKLKFVARVGSGLENIDIEALHGRRIACISAPEGNRDAVGEHALGMLLCMLNNICRANRQVKNKQWLREENRGVELGEQRVSIVGYGNMGKSFARKLSGFGVEVKVCDLLPNVGDAWGRQTSLEEIFSSTDILSIHTPLTPHTQGMVSMDFIRKFKNPFYLINTARGPIVNLFDLCEALDDGLVLGACLDVLSFEDTSFESGSFDLPIFSRLKEKENVVLTPHIAGWSHQSAEKMARVILRKIKGLGSTT